MKYKVLLCGKSKAIMDDYFDHLGMDYEVQSMSMRIQDIMSHIRYFNPDAIIFCMHKESVETAGIWISLKNKLERYNIPLIIIGNEEECMMFQHDTLSQASLVLTKPILIRNIGSEVKGFINTWKYEHKEEEQEQNVEEQIVVAQEKVAPAEVKLVEKVEEKTEQKKIEEKEVKKHVLVVDDDPMMLRLVKEQLKDLYNVATAINGSLALKFLENKKTDLILMDYEMPGESGAEVLGKIRDNEATSNLPVIFLTGITDKEKIKTALGYKPQGYLLKPIEREMLIEIIEKTI